MGDLAYVLMILLSLPFLLVPIVMILSIGEWIVRLLFEDYP